MPSLSPASLLPSLCSCPQTHHRVLALLSWNEILSSGTFKSCVLLRSGLLWGGVKLRHSCTKLELEEMSPWMGLGISLKQGSAFALWHGNLHVCSLFSLLAGWKVVFHHLLSYFLHYIHHRLPGRLWPSLGSLCACVHHLWKGTANIPLLLCGV